jgi:hypothetical protein
MSTRLRRILVGLSVGSALSAIVLSVLLRSSGSLPAEDLAPLEALSSVEAALDWRARVEASIPSEVGPVSLEKAGYMSFREDDVPSVGWVHYGNWRLMEDDRVLDPEQPEAYLFKIDPNGERRLVAAVFMLPLRYTYANTPRIAEGGGDWHLHPNLCLAGDPYEDPSLGWFDLGCPHGPNFPRSLMIHAWLIPNACGPFASEYVSPAADAGATPGASFDAADRFGQTPGCDRWLAKEAWPGVVR